MQDYPHLNPPPSRGRRYMGLVPPHQGGGDICSGYELKDIILYVGEKSKGR